MKILITAGPTREKIDEVRFISNRSSGRMGYALAAAAAAAGHQVTLVSGPVSLPEPEGVETVKTESAAEMAKAVFSRFGGCNAVIMAAAVADYRPAEIIHGKLKKSGDLELRLVRTQDILLELGRRKQHQRLIGFAAESENLLASAADKLKRKNLDWIAANLVADGFAGETDRITLLGRNGERIAIPVGPKTEIAPVILKTVLN